jgi:hypothetical protein
MNDPVVMDPPSIDMPAVTEAGWRREYLAFLRMLPELLKSYQGKYVAVYGGRVVAVGHSFPEAALAAYRRHGYVPLHVDLVTERHSFAVRLPSSRVGPKACS